MRVLMFILALVFTPQALAQDSPNISGLRLGMSVEEVRDVSADLQWPSDLTRPRFKATEVGRVVAGVRLVAFDLIFENGALEFVGGAGQITAETAERCMDQIVAVITEVERSAGPLNASEADIHPADLEPVRTANGSFVRRYPSGEGVVGVVATANAFASIEVRGGMYQTADGYECPITFGMSAAAPIPSDLPRSTIDGVVWLARPDVARYYPVAAMEVGRPGEVFLICTVAADGSLTACRIGHENPSGWGFGEAALRAVRHVRMALQTVDGTPTPGATVRQVIRFRQAY
jgi:TonB family protein